MDDAKKKKIITWVAIGILAAAIIVIAVVFIWGKRSAPQGTGTTAGGGASSSAPQVNIVQVAAPQSAYALALARAASWESDAAPVKVTLGDTSGGAWTFVFVSQKAKGKALQVVVAGQTVSSAEELSFLGAGVPLPANMIAPDAAIAAAHDVPGYGSAAVVSLEAIYSASAKQWYWGVRTATGATITIKATH